MNRLSTNMKSRALPLLPMLLLLVVALLAPVLSNNVAVLVISFEGIHVPVAGDVTPEEDRIILAIHPPVPYLPTDIDLVHASQPPLTTPHNRPWFYTHWLGTDELGRDVLAHLIYGCRTSVLIAFCAMIIALTAGLLLGAISGYWHQRQLVAEPLVILLTGFLIILLFNAGRVLFIRNNPVSALFLTTGIILLFAVVIYKANELMMSKKGFSVNLKARLFPDAIIVGIINFFTAIPAYFALLALLALWPEPSAASLSVILGLLMWPDIARLTRSAVIKNRSSGWAESAESLGYSPVRITFLHLLPNALQPALAALSFGIGGAIMAESFLSFIGIAPAEMVSWGTMLAKIRSYPEMWWLSVFPGIAILFAILTFYRVAEIFEPDRKQK